MNDHELDCPAVVTAAGHATRFVPFSRYLAKEILPLGAEPALGHVIAECLNAKANPVYVVTRPDDTHVRAYCADLNRRGLPVTAVPEDTSHGYGNAAGLLTLADQLSKAPTFLVAFGDDILLAEQPGKDLAAMRRRAETAGASVVAAQLVPHHDVGSYGVIDTALPDADQVTGIRQRPEPTTVREPLALVSRLALHPSILELLKPRPEARGEVDLGLAVDELAHTEPVTVHRLQARWVTVGSPGQYHHALNAYWALPAAQREVTTVILSSSEDSPC